MKYHDKRFPSESIEYRTARDKLLSAEIELRAQLEKIAAMRKALPLGGALKEEYEFEEFTPLGSTKKTKFSELFAPQKNSLIIYSFMYGPNMQQPCPACTSIIDSLNASVDHVTDRANLIVIAKSPIERINAFAKTRNWDKIRLLSSANNNYNVDYFAEDIEGNQLPALNVFAKTKNDIHHFYNAELLYARLDGHPRHVDLIWPLWNLLDMTPEGRGTDWLPKLVYNFRN